MGENWYDSFSTDIGELKGLLGELGDDLVDLVTDTADAIEGAYDSKWVAGIDEDLSTLSGTASQPTWAGKAKDVIADLKSALPYLADHPAGPRLKKVNSQLISGRKELKALKDLQLRIRQHTGAFNECFYDQDLTDEDVFNDRLQNMLDACNILRDQVLETMMDAIPPIGAIHLLWKGAPSGGPNPFVELDNMLQTSLNKELGPMSEQINENLARLQAALGEVEGVQAQRAEEAKEFEKQREQQEAEAAKLESAAQERRAIRNALHPGELEGWATELAEDAYKEWFEKNAEKFYHSGKSGSTAKIPLTEAGYTGVGPSDIEMDTAIKGTGKAEMDKSFGPMFDPTSEGVVTIEFTFNVYFNAKSDNFKNQAKGTMTWNRSFSYSAEYGMEMGINQDKPEFGGWEMVNDEAVAR